MLKKSPRLIIHFLSPDFDEEKLQRDGGGALTISEARQLLMRALERDKEEAAGNRDAMQIPWVSKKGGVLICILC